MKHISQPVLGFFREKLDIEEFNFKAPQYKQAYRELIELLESRGVYVAILMGNGTYQGEGVFSKHWVLTGQGDGEFVFQRRGPVEVDAVWVKDRFDGKDVPQINSREFRQVCLDKHLTYQHLGEFQPASILASSIDQLEAAIDQISGDHIVVKALEGNSGDAVFVGKKDSFDSSKFNHPMPWQVQEYIETSGGIPGIVEGRHDFRVIMINGRPVIATLRTPPEGGLKSNLGYGGQAQLFEVSKIPSELLEICSGVDQKLAKISNERFYSADFGLTSHGWRLFEINAMPGTLNRERGQAAVYYQGQVADFLAEAARKFSKKEEL